MKIAIANDHRGVERKNEIVNHLKSLGHTVINCGTDSNESVDYPKYAFDVSSKVSNKEVDLGILLCGTGIGMSIAANKVKGIRCAKVDNINDAYLTRLHNNANILAMSSENDLGLAIEIIDTFINTEFSNDERHINRIKMISDYER